MILELMKSLYAHDVIDDLPFSMFWRLWFLERNSVPTSKIGFPLKLFDIWIPQTATCQKLEAKLLRYAFAKHEVEYWKHILYWNRKEMINENPGILSIVIIFAWRLLDIFEKSYRIMKISKFSNLRFLPIFFRLPKHEIYRKTSIILLFVLYDITYIQNTDNGKQLFELACKLKYYALLFLESIYLCPVKRHICKNVLFSRIWNTTIISCHRACKQTSFSWKAAYYIFVHVYESRK